MQSRTSVIGLTTAATIWMAAAVGMAVGYGAYYLAGGVTLVMLFTLILLSKLEGLFSRLHQVKFYKISFLTNEFSLAELQKKLNHERITPATK